MANTDKQHTLLPHVMGNTYNAAHEQQNNIVGQRIAGARNQYGISLAKFSTLLETYGVSVSAAAISKWELGRAIPSAYQLLAVAKALHMEDSLSQFMEKGDIPELNAEGLQKVADYKADLIASGRYKLHGKSRNIIKFVDMPVSNLAVSAGTGEFLEEGNFEMVSFPESSVPAGAEFGLRVAGDSMEPVYHDGQIVWVQQCDSVPVGSVGIFIYDGEGYIKSYDEQYPDEGIVDEFTDSYGTVHMQPVMVSYNQKYSPRPISANAGFQVVGRVL